MVYDDSFFGCSFWLFRHFFTTSIWNLFQFSSQISACVDILSKISSNIFYSCQHWFLQFFSCSQLVIQYLMAPILPSEQYIFRFPRTLRQSYRHVLFYLRRKVLTRKYRLPFTVARRAKHQDLGKIRYVTFFKHYFPPWLSFGELPIKYILSYCGITCYISSSRQQLVCYLIQTLFYTLASYWWYS